MVHHRSATFPEFVVADGVVGTAVPTDFTATESGSHVDRRAENEIVRKLILAFLAVASVVVIGCSESDVASKSGASTRKEQASAPAKTPSVAATSRSDSADNVYMRPTADEAAPMRPEYMAELAKIREPPEMAGKPLQVRKEVSPGVVKVGNAISALGSPETANHEQRASAIRELLEIVHRTDEVDGIDRPLTYSVIAIAACFDGADPQTVIGYLNHALGIGNDSLALRARMYLRAGDRIKALDDLEKIMADGDEYVLTGGDVDPRQDSSPCRWSISDFDALGSDPRALAAKGLYLSAFIRYGAEGRGTVSEANIRGLFERAAKLWRSPIPYVLKVKVDGLGSQKAMAGARCVRTNGLRAVPELVRACEAKDEGIRAGIRELTMALVIQPAFAPALSTRANMYLRLAQSSYEDGKPSRQLFELAIKDFTAALAADGSNQHTLYYDRALALASLGRYQEAASGYVQGMGRAENGIEKSPFVYQQLANVYMKLGKFDAAAEIATQGIMNASGGGMDSVIFGGGIGALRTLYPEYDALPDEILAEAVRRRYQPQFPNTWDTDFISKGGASKRAIASSILPEFFVLRGDAYMKAGRRTEALADYRRVKSDAWVGDNKYLPRHLYFDARGMRNFRLPEPWPPRPPTM